MACSGEDCSKHCSKQRKLFLWQPSSLFNPARNPYVGCDMWGNDTSAFQGWSKTLFLQILAANLTQTHANLGVFHREQGSCTSLQQQIYTNIFTWSIADVDCKGGGIEMGYCWMVITSAIRVILQKHTTWMDRCTTIEPTHTQIWYRAIVHVILSSRVRPFLTLW